MEPGLVVPEFGWWERTAFQRDCHVAILNTFISVSCSYWSDSVIQILKFYKLTYFLWNLLLWNIWSYDLYNLRIWPYFQYITKNTLEFSEIRDRADLLPFSIKILILYWRIEIHNKSDEKNIWILKKFDECFQAYNSDSSFRPTSPCWISEKHFLECIVISPVPRITTDVVGSYDPQKRMANKMNLRFRYFSFDWNPIFRNPIF